MVSFLVLIHSVKDVRDYICMCLIFFCIYFMYVCGMCLPWHEWDVRGQLAESFLSFRHVDSGHQTRFIRLGCKCLQPLSPLASPTKIYLKNSGNGRVQVIFVADPRCQVVNICSCSLYLLLIAKMHANAAT